MPLLIIHAMGGKLPATFIDGSKVYRWLQSSSHCNALKIFIECRRVSKPYIVSCDNEDHPNVVRLVCQTIDDAFTPEYSITMRFPKCPAASGQSCASLISFVTDRPGQDHRYAIDAEKLARELGNRCSVGFEEGLGKTVQWYLDNETWWRDVTSGTYQNWIAQNYGFQVAV